MTELEQRAFRIGELRDDRGVAGIAIRDGGRPEGWSHLGTVEFFDLIAGPRLLEGRVRGYFLPVRLMV